jgi:hypothetical protein
MRKIIFLIFIIFNIICFCNSAFASSDSAYNFERIAETNSDFTSLSSPTLNNRGDVLFTAGLRLRPSLVLNSQGKNTVIASLNDNPNFRNITSSSINDNGLVAFSAFGISAPQQHIVTTGINADFTFHVSSGDFPNGRAIPDLPFSSFNGVNINNSGEIAAKSTTGRGGFGFSNAIAKIDETGANIVAEAGNRSDFPFFGLGNSPRINDKGTIAFLAGVREGAASTGTTGIVFSDGVNFDTVIRSETSDFRRFTNFDINNNDVLTFSARLDGGGEALVLKENASLTFIANSNVTNFNTFSSLEVNDSSEVAFQAENDDGSSGIYAGNIDRLMKVISTNDILNGKSISSLSFLDGFNNQGDIAFQATFTDRTQGIFKASLLSAVPEPATWLMMVFGFAGIGMALKRRRRIIADI